MRNGTDMQCEIRLAREGDAEGLSAVIRAALRETNAKDYSPAVIDRLAANFSPAAVRDLMRVRCVFVAVQGRQIVGTASLEHNEVRTVFVAPQAQGQGIGSQLMADVERAARHAGVAMLTVPSSITAEGFYAKLGYAAVRERPLGEERIVIMQRRLTD